ncbi:MAG: hypothetical protein ACRD2Z_00600 [Thermoanaerobaculia bacterium]
MNREEYAQHGEQATGSTIDARADHELERQGHRQAGGEQQEILEPVDVDLRAGLLSRLI